MLILPGQIHAYETRATSQSELFIFSGDMVQDFYETIKEKRFQHPVCRIAQMDQLVSELVQTGNLFVRKALLYYICARIYETSAMVPAANANYGLASTIALYVEQHYAEDISLKQLSRIYGYNYTYLSAFFNANFRQKFCVYVNRFRLHRAVYLLETTNHSITWIADESGFSTIRNFNAAFKKQYQMTPREYRNMTRRRFGTE